MARITVRVSAPVDQHMLQEIVEGAMALDDGTALSADDPQAHPPDVLLVPATRDETATLEGGGDVVALDRHDDHLNLYVLRFFDRVRGSAQLASAIRRLASRVTRRPS